MVKICLRGKPGLDPGLGQSLGKVPAIHSSISVWINPWMKELGRATVAEVGRSDKDYTFKNKEKQTNKPKPKSNTHTRAHTHNYPVTLGQLQLLLLFNLL